MKDNKIKISQKLSLELEEKLGIQQQKKQQKENEQSITLNIGNECEAEKTSTIQKELYCGRKLIVIQSPAFVQVYGKQTFDIMKDFVNVTIPFNYEKKSVNKIDNQSETDINEAKQRVINYMDQSSRITIKELVEVRRYSDGYVRKILSSLMKKKIIECQGGNKTGKWVLDHYNRK